MTPSENANVVLVTISGPDGPGITSHLTGILAQAGAKVLDIGQAVIHGLLSLSILFELDEKDADKKTTIKDLLFKATELGMKLDFKVIDPESPTSTFRHNGNDFRYALTLISTPVTASSLHKVTQVLSSFQLNIDSIQRLSQDEFGCVELLVSSPSEVDQKQMKHELLKIAEAEKVDIALQAEGLFRRAKRLVVMDMDSTLIQNEVIDELARDNSTFEEVAKITETAMNGKMDFDESFKKRCQLLSGLDENCFEKVFSRIQLTPGAEDLSLIHI